MFTLLPLLVLGAIALAAARPPALELTGLEDGALVGGEAAQSLGLAVTFSRPVDESGALTALLDGRPVALTVSPGGESAELVLPSLSEGDHELVVHLDRGLLSATVTERRSFRVDLAPPGLEVLSPTAPIPPLEPVVVRARVDDPEAVVEVDGERVELGEGGTFERTYPEPPDEAVTVVLTDEAGNQATHVVSIELALPGAPGGPPIRGVHATGWTWATPELRDPILQMIREGRINTVQLDLKDESGDIWYATEVALAHEIGAVTVLYDLARVVDELHAMGVRVIGRLVAFRDPRLAEHAVETGQLDLVVQNPDGTAFGKYGGFTNPYHRTVREYNIAIAEEAARLGVDDILYDYVRRPDEHIERMVFPGRYGPPEDAIVSFLAESRVRVHAAGARLGASVFGVAATRPHEIAQDIPRMSEHVDYIAPMLYPSHWAPGEYGVDHPNAQPYDIIYRSLVDFREKTSGTGAGLVAWLQDFSLGIDYGPAEVAAQIEAAEDAGVVDFLLWDPATTYTTAALPPR